MNTTVKRVLPILVLFLTCASGMAQIKNNFEPRYNDNLKGEITLIGNNIVNRQSERYWDWSTWDWIEAQFPNDPYNFTGNQSDYNDDLNMQYIDVDGDDTTYSSSSAQLAIPNPDCSRIRYAGLYWAAVYAESDRSDFNQVKFKTPTGSYVDLAADEILFDGYNDSDFGSYSPYACYKDVTNIVAALSDPNGEYLVANIRASSGSTITGGISGGWTLVVVYEDPTLPGKYITTFDGYAGIKSGETLEIPFSGFTTLPNPFPVRAKLGVATLEGDNRISGDQLSIRANSTGTFTNLGNSVNPTNNFFNSNITIENNIITTRNPNSTNTLGWDVDMFTINNPNNSVIPNDETGATLRASSTQDKYDLFFTSMDVEVIEPNISLVKTVENIDGDDITGQGVNLGQSLDYILAFKNTGNDDATNYSIRDVLPTNVSLIESNLSLPPGVTYTYNPATKEVIFNIPDNLVEENDPFYEIRMRVRVAENCFDFVDACTDQIQNLAYSTYQGVLNDNQITDDPSVYDFDSCGFTTPGATNFLLDDLENCDFVRTVQLCGDNVLLDAGDNFDAYVWYQDTNNNGIIDTGEPVLTDGDSDNDPSTLLVTETGTYIVDKQVADPCKGFQEIITVERFGTTQTNPIIDFFNASNNDADPNNDIQGEIVSCSIDGDLLPKIFLCGTNDSQLIQVNITDAQSIVWEQLDEGSCSPAGDDCANKNQSCSWSQVNTGNTFNLNNEGKYRLVVNYQNGCFSRFYFNAFQNNLDIQYTNNDIVCTTPGNITVTNLGSGYGFELINETTNSTVVPFSANNGPSFDITSNGSYRINVVQLDPTTGEPLDGACIFSTPVIGIRDRDFQVDINTTMADCHGLGSINLQVLDVEPNYSYELRLDDGSNGGTGTLLDSETAQADNNFTFDNLNPGNYITIVRSDDGCEDIQQLTIGQVPDLTLNAVTTAQIGCTDGSITLTAGGGNPNPGYNYALWSRNGTPLYADISDIPGYAYQIDPVFQFSNGEAGTYTFIVVDANNCWLESNAVTIQDLGGMTIATTTSNISCYGASDGSISMVPTNGIAPYEYSIDGGTTYQPNASFVNLAPGTYQVRVRDNSGCDVVETVILNQPEALTASAGMSRDVTCDPSNGGEVRITNVEGGTAPYEYNFNGTYQASPSANLLPGSYTVYVRDANGCDYAMPVTVEPAPIEPEITAAIDYDCDGNGIITMTPDINTYDYTYALNGTNNSPDPSSQIFTNVSPGNHTVTVNYTSQNPPPASQLLTESFGTGGTVSSPNTTGYCFEPQDGTNTCLNAAININDGEYAVTNRIQAPYSSWLNPTDHTGLTNGRYLAINIGAPGVGQALYRKPIRDVIPNQPVTVSVWAINLLRSGTGGLDPNLTMELVDPNTGSVIASQNTSTIPKNNNWNQYLIELNPGNNTELEFVLRTQVSGTNGNDIAIDDIAVYQIPEMCSLSVDVPLTIESGRAFEAQITNWTNVSCNGAADGSISFSVENFDASSGFEYAIDGGSWISATTSPVTTSSTLGAGVHTIVVRKANDTSCTAQLTQEITEPSAVVANASITSPLSCTNSGATITASASGGSPGYSYQLEDNNGNILVDYASNGSNRVFSGLAAGDYLVKARDTNTCEDSIDAALTVDPLVPIAFDVSASTCYTGTNDGTITVENVSGNGNYVFSLNGGPWITPSPASANTHTFSGLSAGTYTLNVRDGMGCDGTAETVTINPALRLTASAPIISACETAADIQITATGGDGNYVYAVVADGVAPIDTDFSTTNPVAEGPGAYDVYVRDNGGNAVYCQTQYDLTITQEDPISLAETHVDVSCNGGADGSITLNATDGGGNFRYSIDGGTTFVTTATFNNLSAGSYNVVVRDVNNCEETTTITIDGPEALSATVSASPYTCMDEAEITVNSVVGGSGSYQFRIVGQTAWLPAGGTTNTTLTFANTLTAGNYTIEMRDFAAPTCSWSDGITINPLPTAPSLTTDVSYNCDGSGNITITPSDPTYTYSLNGGTAQTTAVFNNIAVGTHTVTVDYGSSCTADVTVIVEAGMALNAGITAYTEPTCNGAADGSITFEVSNFDPVNGFEYSTDGGTTYTQASTSPITLNNLGDGPHNIEVRDTNDTSCSIPLTQTLNAPTAVEVTATITAVQTCTDGATITATATGGTPTYEYQLEDTSGAPIAGFDFATNGNNPVFTNLATGDYMVRARDNNTCSDITDTAISVADPATIAFDLTATACYSGNNDGTILVDVTAGNGNYQFRIDGGPWITPNPVASTTHTFTGLSAGTYTVEVNDQFGCVQSDTVDIIDALSATVAVVDVSCNDGSITVTATGGTPNLEYAFVSAGGDPSGLFATNNSHTVAAADAGAYDVYVRDNNAASPYCEFMETVTVNPATPLTITSTPTDPECHDGLGSIELDITSGLSPFTIELIDLDHAGASNQTLNNVVSTNRTFYNLPTGDYTVNVTDAAGCTETTSVTINNPTELVADISPVIPPGCSVNPNDFGFKFENYPTTLGDIEFSDDGGVTWTAGDNSVPGTSDIITGYNPGDVVQPSMRTVDGSGNTICRTDFPELIIPYPLDDLDISISTIVVNCNELQVTVQGTAGLAPYEYAYTDDPANFDPATASWTAQTNGSHTWTGLIPGRSYVFYVRDDSPCVRQSTVNVAELETNPIEIASTYEPSCSGANDGEITYTLTDTDANSYTNIRWELYDLATGSVVQTNPGNPNGVPAGWTVNPGNGMQETTVTVNGLSAGEYFIVVTEMDGSGTEYCVSGSQNLLLEELDPISGNPSKIQDITCEIPGLVQVTNMTGGGGTFTYTLSSPNFTADIVSTSSTIEVPLANIDDTTQTPFDINVSVVDQFGCPQDLGDIPMEIAQPPSISGIAIDNCDVPSDVTITATTSASGTLLYSIDGGATYVNNGGIFNNVAAGTYSVSVMDSNGCTATDTFTVQPELQVDVQLTKLLDCTPDPEAEITIEVLTGSGNYDYEITGPVAEARTTLTLTAGTFVWDQANVAGTYNVTIYDIGTDPNCSRSFTVEVPTEVSPAFSTTPMDVSCIGGNDGSIRVAESNNGINPLTYTINPAVGSFDTATNTFEGLTAGTYTITATGTNDCTTTSLPITIGEPAAIAVSLNPVAEFACTAGNAEQNAGITVSGATGGNGTYVRYEFINDDTSTVVQDSSNPTYIETDLAGGNYTVNVYDSNGCSGSTTATIQPFVGLDSLTLTPTDPSCNPGADGSVEVDVAISGVLGSTNLQFDINGTGGTSHSDTNTDNTTNHTFTGLDIGTYMVTVTNTDTGCLLQMPVEIEDPNTFTIDVDITSDVICHGTPTGTVEFSISDATYTGGFDYQVFEQGTHTDMTAGVLNHVDLGPTAPVSLPAGDYYVVITQDGNPLCQQQENFSIAGPSAAITANTQVSPITCVGADGVIEIINPNGGWGGYTYYVGTVAPSLPGDFDPSPTFDGLAAGTYEAWVRDAQGCEQLVQSGIVLADPDPIVAALQINDHNCSGFEGEIEVVGIPATNPISGGQGSNYSFQLMQNGTAVGGPQTSAVFSGLGAGTYEVVISDQWTCDTTVGPVELYDPIAFTAEVTTLLDCEVGTAGNAEISITVNQGSGNYEYEISGPAALAPTAIVGNSVTWTGANAPGAYTITIYDVGTSSPECTASTIVQVPDIVQPIFTETHLDVTCNGGADGSITLIETDNGINPLNYTITPVAGSFNTATNAFVGLPAGTYTITGTATNSCSDDITVTIDEPNAIGDITASVIPFGCAAGNALDAATITVDETSITGGSGNFVRYEFINDATATVVQDGPNPSYMETDIAGGNYTINVYDTNGCPGTTTAVIAPIVTLSNPVVSVNTDVTCNGDDEDIAVSVTLDNPASITPNLEYTVSGMGGLSYSQTIVSNNTSETFTGLGVGNYEIAITNVDTGCTVLTTHIVEEPNTMEVIATKLTDEDCLNNGMDDGSFEVNINQYSGAYSYQVYDMDGNAISGFTGTSDTSSPLIISGLPGGIYYVSITQDSAPFCETNSGMVTIEAPEQPISATITEVHTVSCTNDQGRLLVDPEGGEAPYTITVDSGTQSFTQTDVAAHIFEGLSAGTFTVTITDALGCVFTDSIVLTQPNPIVANISPDVMLSCVGDTNGTATATIVSGGYGTAQYQLNLYDSTGSTIMETSAVQDSNSFGNLAAGIYSITITDEGNCGVETAQMTIADPVDVLASLIRTQALSCTQQATLELTASGGTGPYFYSEDGNTFLPMTGGNTHTFSVDAGTYQYFVRDSFNCTSIVSNSITEDPIEPLTATVDTSAAVINCNGESTALIVADADGGMGNYQYELFTDATLLNSVTGTAQADGTFDNLSVGDYYLRVTSEDCEYIAPVISIVEPDPLVVTDSFTNISCNGADDGRIHVELSGGSGGYQYAISPNLDQFDTINTFTDLTPGDYTVIAQDINGCFEVLEYTLTEPTIVEVLPTITHEICSGSEDGTIEVAISGGTAPYSTAFNSNTDADFVAGQTSFTDLAAGTYVIFVRDANGCETNIIAEVEAGVNLNATAEVLYECTGTSLGNSVVLNLEDPSVEAELIYGLDSTDPLQMQLEANFSNLSAGDHYITIAHSNGCINTIPLTIEDYEPLTLTLEQHNINEITATVTGGRPGYTYYFDGKDNGDDNTFYINRTDTFTVRVVDDKGCEIESQIAMEFIDIEMPDFFTPDGDGMNDRWIPRNIEAFPQILTIIFDRYGREVYRLTISDQGWDGTYNKKDLPTGDYWYVIKLRGENDDREFVGHFTLYR